MPGGADHVRVTRAVRMSDDGGMPATHDSGAGMHRYSHGRFDAHLLAEVKGHRRISVCIPARDEAPTVGAIVDAIVSTLAGGSRGAPLLDEVLVIDDGSTDGTGDLARQAGARVLTAPGPAGSGFGGKGQAMRAGLEAAVGDLVVFVDGDVTNFGPHFVTGMVGPLLLDDTTTLVKGFYDRPLHGAPDGGGRVTELVARPVIDLLFPELADVLQPLAGETAAPRWVLEKCELADGYAVELALLVDVASRFGAETIAQVDLGVRVHRNRPLSELRPQATDILRVALARAGIRPAR